jgi:hypothetical protein
MPFQQPPQYNLLLPAGPAFTPLFNFQQPIDNVFDAQLITSFAMNDLTHTTTLNDMYPNDVLILADKLNKTPPQYWNAEIKNALMTVAPDYWKTQF